MRYLFGFVAFLFLACQSPQKGSLVKTDRSLSIMQGVTSAKWTRINLLRPRSASYQVEFLTQDGSGFPDSMVKRNTNEFQASEWVVDGFLVEGLNPGATYQMVVKEDGKVIDHRYFKSLSLQQPSYRFAVVSCTDDHYAKEQGDMWRSLANEKPDFILTIGDNVYGDRDQQTFYKEGVPSHVLWKRYTEMRQKVDLYKLRELVPVVAVWDDHDYGVNDGDRRYKNKNESLVIFHSFFPQDFLKPEFQRGPGASSVLKLGRHNFVFLDNRSFRSPNQKSPICRTHADHHACRTGPVNLGPDRLARWKPETHFGKEQERWLKGELLKLVGKPVFLVSGDQWFGAYQPFESFEGSHPNDFKSFMKKLAKSQVPVVFLAGDRHTSEISRVEKDLLGYETIEIVSSPMHAKLYPDNWKTFPNPRQIAGLAEASNFNMIESQVVETEERKEWKLKVRAVQAGGKAAYEREFSLPLE